MDMNHVRWSGKNTRPKTVRVTATNTQRRSRGDTWWWATAMLTVLTLWALPESASALRKMQLVHTWGPVNFVFNNDAQRQQLEKSGAYKQGNTVPFDVDVDPQTGRVFVALPWVLPGGAVTLATVEKNEQLYSPRLVPYPDWSWHAGGRGCEGLTSVFRTHVDRCGRLWVIDSGIAEITTTFRRKCPPQLLVFDLKTNQLLARHRYDVPKATCTESLLLSVTVEQMGNTCGADAFAYVADAGAFAIYVYSLREKKSWRVPSYLFYPDVNARVFEVAGTSMNLMDAVLGLAVSPPVQDQKCGKYLFFHSLSSFQEGRVCTSILRNASLFADGENAVPEAFQFIGRRASQAADQAITSGGVLFFSPVGTYSINCWNHRREYRSANLPVVELDKEVIRFVTGIKVVAKTEKGKSEEVWAIANNAQLLFTGQFRPNVNNTVNIFRGDARNLVAGVNC